jgi:hypothetical protein
VDENRLHFWPDAGGAWNDRPGDIAVGGYVVEYEVGFTLDKLHDEEKPARKGSKIPLTVVPKDDRGNNLSGPDFPVKAKEVRKKSSQTSPLPPEDAGNANPDDNFRLAGDKYVYNFDSKGLDTGTWEMIVEVGDEKTEFSLQILVK